MLKTRNKIYLEARKVLQQNFRNDYTVPSSELYPHQWLWDSCFIAIGLRHYNLKRAKNELISLKLGQWKNGMLPNITFHSNGLNFDDELWDSHLNRFAPKDVKTSGITQPPMLAEAIFKVGQKLEGKDRIEFYGEMIDCLVRYHQWLYLERDPHENGLISLVHPYESGLDNSPVWLTAVHRLRFPWWIRFFKIKNFKKFFNYFRRDTSRVAESQRISLSDAAEYFYIIKKLKKYKYDSRKILRRSRPLVEDLAFNSILVRANQRLKLIAREVEYKLPRHLLDHMRKTEHSLEKLWDSKNQQYYSRYLRSKKFIKNPTVASLLPLYSGSLSRPRAKELVDQLKDHTSFGCHYPVPSVPINSKYFDPNNFWQGPSWVNTNWLIIQGLHDYGFHKEAQDLKRRSIKMVGDSGFYEYFSPFDGSGKGAANFSWTAALTIDLLKT
jgi:hypothetical protein